MRLFKTLGALSCLSWVLACSGVAAQTISQPTFTTWLSGSNLGQSFRATLTGEVVAISVGSVSTRAATLYVYNGPLGSGTSGAIGAPVRTQAITLNAAALGVLQRIDLTTPLPVVVGSSYSFIISGPSDLSGALTNPYANGNLIFNFASQVGGTDVAFAVFEQAIAPAVAANPASIPSSSTWSLIGAGAFIMAAALFQRRRSGRQSQR